MTLRCLFAPISFQLALDIAAQVTAKASQTMKLSSASRLAVDQSVR